MAEMDWPFEQVGHQNRGGQGPALGVDGDGAMGRPAVKMGHPERHRLEAVVQAERAVGGVEVHFQAGGPVRQSGPCVYVVRTGPDEESEIASGFLPGQGQRSLEGGFVCVRRLGVGHGQNGGDAAGQGRGRAGVPVLFVGGAGFAHVNVDVDEPGEFHGVFPVFLKGR